MEKDFKKAEKRERDCLKYLELNNPLEYKGIGITEIGSYYPYDGIGHVKDGNFKKMGYVEVKIRDFNSSDYPTAYLEKKKVDNLIEFSRTEEYIPSSNFYYFAVYPKSKEVYVFNILSTPHTLELNVRCPKTTMGNTEMINKDMVAFKLEDAILKIKL